MKNIRDKNSSGYIFSTVTQYYRPLTHISYVIKLKKLIDVSIHQYLNPDNYNCVMCSPFFALLIT